MDTMIHIRSLVRAGPLGRPARYAALKVRGGYPPLRGGPRKPDAAAKTVEACICHMVPGGMCIPSDRSIGLPRKEVIQPHLPVRLPCYDFTPLTLHTFGASLARLGRRLRVQTTRVV